ncbi:GMC family oxidoreductase [Aureimonas leprariae]|uniref:GMC family oxidoreductase n=1 Tax=Plantimonas leprariae TaxID=2615207 RepID=A0A7V7TV48_9HYPH|nr:GMC family oxidoreductase [Aureimonas leprariae]KAB0677542.1 GMC family oxidoreductase [Aureimonas leprariae]
MTKAEYDVVVVGAGAAGAIAACVLAEAGQTVLLVERGRVRTYGDSGHRDHLRNHRLQAYGFNTGPDIEGNPRVFVDQAGERHVVRPHEPGYHVNAAGVGGGTFVYGGLAWRFHPDDFRMASLYGRPAASSLTDWPFGYDELEPWYERAEQEIGVSGDGSGDRNGGPRRRDYPMPPVAANRTTARLAAGADALGLSTFAPPLLVNTVPRDGRDACIRCGSCVGFPCPSGAKNGTQNTALPRALATGRCTLLVETVVEGIATDGRGTVVGVDILTADGEFARRRVSTRAVVLSAGAIESARLLLMTRTRREPNGLGNNADQVGRNLQGHYYPTVFGLFDEDVQDSRGPGVTIATTDFNHGNDGVVGGAMLADDFVMLPIILWKSGLPDDLPRYGLVAKRFMRDNFRRIAQIKGPVHEIPDPECRVALDGEVRDRYGRPVARLSGTTHPETVRTAEYIRRRADEWMRAAGAVRTWSKPPHLALSAGQHQAGTCRMGDDPAVSVTDRFGKVWGHENLYVCDASLHPTNGGYNPVLTVMALAFRNASSLAQALN